MTRSLLQFLKKERADAPYSKIAAKKVEAKVCLPFTESGRRRFPPTHFSLFLKFSVTGTESQRVQKQKRAILHPGGSFCCPSSSSSSPCALFTKTQIAVAYQQVNKKTPENTLSDNSMSSFAQSGSVRAISKMFENISATMTFTTIDHSVDSKAEKIVDPTENDTLETIEEVPASPLTNTENQILNGSKTVELDEQVESNSGSKIVGPEEVSNNKSEELKSKVPDETKVYKHIKEYPIVNSWIKIFHWIPAPRILRPTLMRVAYSSTLGPYTDGIDTFFDNRLGQLDEAVPFIKELRMRDIRNIILDDPIKAASARTTKAFMDANDLTQKMIVEPSRDGIHRLRDLRGEYITVGDNQPIIRSQINPLIKQVNTRMVDSINQFFPAREDEGNLTLNYVSMDGDSNELSYTFQLINIGVLRSRPVLQERFEQLLTTPNTTAKHVAAIYQESKTNRGEGRIVVIIATVETIRKLVEEGYTLISASTFFEFLGTSPSDKEKLSIAEEKTDKILPEKAEPESEALAIVEAVTA